MTHLTALTKKVLLRGTMTYVRRTWRIKEPTFNGSFEREFWRSWSNDTAGQIRTSREAIVTTRHGGGNAIGQREKDASRQNGIQSTARYSRNLSRETKIFSIQHASHTMPRDGMHDIRRWVVGRYAMHNGSSDIACIT